MSPSHPLRSATRAVRRTPAAAALTAALALALLLLTALGGTASAAVPNLQRAARSTQPDSQPAKDRFVSCPTGTKLISGGGNTAGGFGQVILDGIRLDQPLNTVAVRGFEDANGTSLSWSLNAFAVCGNVPGLQQVNASRSGSDANQSVAAICPAGKQVVGAGAETSGGVGRVVLDDLRPTSDHTRVIATGFEAEGGTTDSWTITAHAMCANPLPGLEVRKLSSEAGSFDGGAVTETCSAGKKVVGAGGEITGGLGQVIMNGITPSADLKSVTVSAHEDGNGTSFNWNLTAYAICATP
jgi:hypothetical protein